MLGSVHDARDVAQEAFLSAFEKLSTFRKESSFYSWLFRIAYNSAVSSRRKQKRIKGSVDRYRDETGFEPVDGRENSSPSSRLQSEENQQLVRNGLKELAPEHRDVIVMKEIEGLRYDEIAELLGCPIGTVRSRIHRARQELREKLTRMMEQEQSEFSP